MASPSECKRRLLTPDSNMMSILESLSKRGDLEKLEVTGGDPCVTTQHGWAMLDL